MSELVVWLNAEATKRPSAVKAAYLWALETALSKYRIEIPFPQQDLHIRSLFGRHGDEALDALHGREDRSRHEAGPEVTLDSRERAALSRNDAEQDVKQQIAQDAAPDTPDPAERD